MQVDFVLDALTTVLDWDLPEDSYSQALNAQVCQQTDTDEDWRSGVWDAAVNITVH